MLSVPDDAEALVDAMARIDANANRKATINPVVAAIYLLREVRVPIQVIGSASDV